MAAVQVKKTQIQAEQTIFALDIGTRSIIGMVGTVENEKIRIIAIEREEHTERAMIDGQIENIDKVAAVAGKVKQKLESKLHFKLERVCVAAAGRALRTKRAEFEMEVSGKDLINDEVISRLEAGAISKAEEAFDAENRSMEDNRRFYLVGYTVCQYYLDKYMISSLKDHRGKSVKVDLIATFLPSEVVESLYTTMNKIGLEVASITLEPIAAINAAIPANLRLLNLVLVDIGAGTSDIAACTDGSVTGYTMATMAGDEITETLMKEYLVDFQMAESMKAQADQEEEITFTDILGFEQTISRDELLACIQDTSDHLCREIADKILEINGNPPSALFLAGGGSKLTGLKEGLTAALQMDSKRVAIAGNNFRTSAFSDEYDLNNPEYATPLGIAVSSGLNLINASFRVILNGRPANLFRSGSFTALNLLMMNGYSFLDIMGHSGANLAVTVNGRRKVFYGTPVEPAALFINKKEGRLSEIIQAGDEIDFTPAVSGVSASACLGDINGAAEAVELTLNGMPADLETQLKMGDVIVMRRPGEEALTEEAAEAEEGAAAEDVPAAEEGAEPEPAAVPEQTQEQEPVQQEESAAAPDRTAETAAEFSEPAGTERQPETAEETEPVEMKQEEEPKPALNPQRNFAQRSALEAAAPVSQREEKTAVSAQPPEVHFHLNGMPITLPRKTDGTSYFLMDMIQYSGIDLKQPKGRIVLTVNGMQGLFQQELRDGDNIRIEEEM
ncbi:MAG: cell division protein FtsA [Lachnospiraceae bacterium]|nr:cell division protein FtsA [Lachnospiraceae bacterium]